MIQERRVHNTEKVFRVLADKAQNQDEYVLYTRGDTLAALTGLNRNSALRALDQLRRTGIFLYIDPLATVLVAMPLLGEFPGPLYILGAILVFMGIYIAEGRIHWHPIHLLRRGVD